MIRYNVILPNTEKAHALGVSMGGIGSRVFHFLAGMEFAFRGTETAFDVVQARGGFRNGSYDYTEMQVVTNSEILVKRFNGHLKKFGVSLDLAK